MVNIKDIVRPNILTLNPYSSARDEFSGDEGIFLDANENPFGNLNRYPDPYQKKLKRKLSDIKKIPVENIFIGNGSDEVIDLAFRIFCNPGKDKALTFTPTYGMYDIAAEINNVQLIKIPLNNTFQIDIKSVDKYLNNSSIKLIFICSPNNPTGNLINKTDIEYILDNFKGIVIIDEAYVDFSLSQSWITSIDKYPNLIVSQTFSKAWGLAAARVGVAYADKNIISFYNKVKPPYNVSELNQKKAIDSLCNIDDFKKKLQTILDEKKALQQALNKIDIVKNIYPSDANFLLVEVTDADYIYNSLVKQQIITRNRNNVVNNCIRITVGNPQENKLLVKALNAISSLSAQAV